MIYVALLRGINVGGHNKVNMRKLKDVFEATGMTDVSTYINSGNVVFRSNSKSATRLAATLEQAIKKSFGFAVKVLVRDQASIKSLVQALPADWSNDTGMKCDVMFLWAAIDHPKILEQLTIKPDIDRVRYAPGALLWSVDRDKVTRSGMMKLVGTDPYRQMTIRNCNTLRKLADLMNP